jgi:hypothetical protein
MPKRFKVGPISLPEILVVGISCQKADYWIAFRINEVLHVDLRRADDLVIDHLSEELKLNYALFHADIFDSRNSCYLIANHHPDRKLFPAQRMSDYFFIVGGRLSEFEKQMLLTGIKKIPSVLTAFFLKLDTMKNFSGIINDLEIHLAGRKAKSA